MSDNPLLAVMKKYKVPMTRAEFLKLRHAGKPPSSVQPEDETEMPDRFKLAYPTHEEQAEEEEAKTTPK